jgi:predicted enzyme related to lactoylglutathione lyase
MRFRHCRDPVGVDWKLEVVVVPVTDVDRAKDFYVNKVGFIVDFDHQISPDGRLAQLTPPGSACSISIGTVRPSGGIVDAEPGCITGLQLVVRDIEAARAELVDRGVAVSEIKRIMPRDGGAFVYFADPDGNRWAVQEFRGHDPGG